MELQNIDIELLEREIQTSTSRSSGPGGQNVNKLNTKVEIRLHIANCTIFSEKQKLLLLKKLASSITNDGELIVTSQSSRSQFKNREDAFNKLLLLINNALKEKKKRKPTRPTRSSKEKRIKDKKAHSEKKSLRNSPDY